MKKRILNWICFQFKFVTRAKEKIQSREKNENEDFSHFFAVCRTHSDRQTRESFKFMQILLDFVTFWNRRFNYFEISEKFNWIKIFSSVVCVLFKIQNTVQLDLNSFIRVERRWKKSRILLIFTLFNKILSCYIWFSCNTLSRSLGS